MIAWQPVSEPPRQQPLHETQALSRNQETLLSICRLRYFFYFDCKIGEAAEALSKNPHIPALAIVDYDERPVGLLLRSRFFSALGRPYALDILHKKNVTELTEKVTTLPSDTSTAIAGEVLFKELDKPDVSYFALIHRDGRFQALLSSQDLLAYYTRMLRFDLRLARKMQEKLVKDVLEIQRPDFTVFGASEMIEGVGGDFYQMREIRPGYWFGCLCDVSGKGLAASLVSSVLWGLLENEPFHQGLKPVLAHLNQTLLQTFDLEKFVTGFFWLYRESSSHLECADMGHSHMAFIHPQRFLRLPENFRNLPMGLEEELPIKTVQMKLRPGDIFVVYSDGLVELANERGESFDLPQSLCQGAYEKKLTKPKALAHHLLGDFLSFRGDTPPSDDVTFLIFRKNDKLPPHEG